jgi:Rod binding domain-containing protein
MQVAGRVGCATEIAGTEPKLIKAAHEFEGQMMKELIRPMTRFDDKDEETGSGGALADFGGEMLGQSLSRAGGFGIASRIIASLSRTETDCAPGSASGKLPHTDDAGLMFRDGPPMSSLRSVAYGDPE